jgi:hypothetical protein
MRSINASIMRQLCRLGARANRQRDSWQARRGDTVALLAVPDLALICQPYFAASTECSDAQPFTRARGLGREHGLQPSAP